jgi:hypothetical protein
MPKAPIAPGLSSVVLERPVTLSLPGRGSTVIFRSAAACTPNTTPPCVAALLHHAPDEAGRQRNEQPSRDNSSEPGYAAANSLRLRSVSRDGRDLSMLCIATSEWARTAPHAAGGLRRHVPVLPRHSPRQHMQAHQRARRTGCYARLDRRKRSDIQPRRFGVLISYQMTGKAYRDRQQG